MAYSNNDVGGGFSTSSQVPPMQDPPMIPADTAPGIPPDVGQTGLGYSSMPISDGSSYDNDMDPPGLDKYVQQSKMNAGVYTNAIEPPGLYDDAGGALPANMMPPSPDDGMMQTHPQYSSTTSNDLSDPYNESSQPDPAQAPDFQSKQYVGGPQGTQDEFGGALPAASGGADPGPSYNDVLPTGTGTSDPYSSTVAQDLYAEPIGGYSQIASSADMRNALQLELNQLQIEFKRTKSLTEMKVAEKIQEYDKSIREETEKSLELKDRYEKIYLEVQLWGAPASELRARLLKDTQQSSARVKGLEEGIMVQRQGMASIQRLAETQIEATKEKLKRVHRNTDALARALGIADTSTPHNEQLQLSIYLWQKHLSEATQALMQARAEASTKMIDISQFKADELRSLIHQSQIEHQLLSANIEKEKAVLAAEHKRRIQSVPTAFDAALKQQNETVAQFQGMCERKQQMLKNVEQKLDTMKSKRHVLEREFQELAVGLKALWPATDVSVNIAEKQLQQIEAIEAQRKELEGKFQERMNTAMAEAKLEEEIKWRNKLELYKENFRQSREKSILSADDSIQNKVQEVGNEFQDKFEKELTKLSKEKEEHGRLARMRQQRVGELQGDLDRINEMKGRLQAAHDARMGNRHRLRELKERFQQRWKDGRLDSEHVEKFLLRVQWTMQFTPLMVTRCRQNMRTLRTHLPTVRSCRADIRQRERIVTHILELQKYVADPVNASAASLKTLRELDMILPSDNDTPEVQHLELEALEESLRQTYADLASELIALDKKLMADILSLEENSSYVFKHKGQEYKEVLRHQDHMAQKKLNLSLWRKKMKGAMPRVS